MHAGERSCCTHIIRQLRHRIEGAGLWSLTLPGECGRPAGLDRAVDAQSREPGRPGWAEVLSAMRFMILVGIGGVFS